MFEFAHHELQVERIPGATIPSLAVESRNAAEEGRAGRRNGFTASVCPPFRCSLKRDRRRAEMVEGCKVQT